MPERDQSMQRTVITLKISISEKTFEIKQRQLFYRLQISEEICTAMCLVIFNYLVDPAGNLTDEFFVGIFLNDPVSVMRFKHGCKIAAHKYLFDIRQILHDPSRNVIISFKVHDQTFGITVFTFFNKLFALIKIIRKAS